MDRRKGNAKRFWSILLAAVMALSLWPQGSPVFFAYAEEAVAEKAAGTASPEKAAPEEQPEGTSPVEPSPEEPAPVGPSEDEPAEPSPEVTAPAETPDGELPAEPGPETDEEPSGEQAAEQTPEDALQGSGGIAPEGQPEEVPPAEPSPEQNTPEAPSAEPAPEAPSAEPVPEVPSDGKEPEAPSAENPEQEPGLCPHHERHTGDCGYGEDTPCGFVCNICPVQALIDALPQQITEDNRDAAAEQLQEILSLYAALDEAEQEQLDLTPCLRLQEELDGANAPQTLGATGDFTVTGGTLGIDYTYENNVLTVKTRTALTISGTTTTDRIEVNGNVSANITLSGVDIDVSGTDGAAAFKIADDNAGDVTVILESSNSLKSGKDCAGLQKNGTTGALTIKGDGSLDATGGDGGAGIGGGNNGSADHITIESGTITAQGGAFPNEYGLMYGGAGIGGGDGGSGVGITICGDATVNATGGERGAGIGGGYNGNGSVTISGDAHVTAQGGAIAVGIGSGSCAGIGDNHCGTVTIEGGTVIATGGDSTSLLGSGGSGAGIGAGGRSNANVTITGGTVTATGGGNIRSKGYGGAGIGSSSVGTTVVTISGGTVIAKGGDDQFGGAGIGSGGFNDGAVNITITGGVVTATGGSDVSGDDSGDTHGPGAGIGRGYYDNTTSSSFSTSFSTTGDGGAGNAFIIATGGKGKDGADGDGITGGVAGAGNGVIVNGTETVWGAENNYTLSQDVEIPSGATLTIPNGKTLTVDGTLTNNGTLTIDGGTLENTGTLDGDGSFLAAKFTAEMVAVDPLPAYNGQDRSGDVKKNVKIRLLGQDFQTQPEKWTLDVAPKGSSLSEYTITYTPTGGGEAVTKDVTLAQSATTFTASSDKQEYAYADTITITATVKASGVAPAMPASRLRGAPASGQMALYEGDTQLGDPATPENGGCSFSIPAKDLGVGEHSLTVKYIGTDMMACAETTVDLAVKPVTLTISGAEVAPKTYDGTTDGVVGSVTLSGVVTGENLTLGTDYTAQAAYDTADAGENRTATVTVTLNDTAAARNYILPVNTFTLSGQTIAPKTLTDPAIELSPAAVVWDGTAQEPAVTVKDGETVLPASQYDVKYENNINVGQAAVTVTGKGNYSFEKEVAFTIGKASRPAAPQLAYTRTEDGADKITVAITEVAGAEYSFDGGATWADTREKTGLDTAQTVTLAIRLKETATHNPSPSQTVKVDLSKKDREVPPAFTLRYDANGEQDYTVTIPAASGCEYSFDGINWSNNNLKTGAQVGEIVTGYRRYKENDEYNASGAVSDTRTMPKFAVRTPTISPTGGSYSGSVSVTITCGTSGAEIYYTTDGSQPTDASTRYTGAFTVTVPATVKAFAVKEGMEDSAVATAQYTKKTGSSGGSGGSSSDRDDDDRSDSRSGNTTSTTTTTTPPAAPPAANPAPAPVAQQTVPAAEPFLKGENGKMGWDVIRAAEENAADGNTVNIDMNGAAVVPGNILDSIKGRNVTVTFDLGNGIQWSVDGKTVTADRAKDIDFSVQTGGNAIPSDLVDRVAPEGRALQLSLAHDGEFGFTAVLSINLGRENAGYTANLYYYKETAGELEFISADEVAEDGRANLAFTHASDYVIAINASTLEDPGTDSAPLKPQPGDNVIAEPEVNEGSHGVPWIAIVIAAIAAGLGIFLACKRKKEEQ